MGKGGEAGNRSSQREVAARPPRGPCWFFKGPKEDNWHLVRSDRPAWPASNTHTHPGYNSTGSIWVSVSVLLCGFGYTQTCVRADTDTQLIKTDQSSREHARQLSESVMSEASANKHKLKEAQVTANFSNKSELAHGCMMGCMHYVP